MCILTAKVGLFLPKKTNSCPSTKDKRTKDKRTKDKESTSILIKRDRFTTVSLKFCGKPIQSSSSVASRSRMLTKTSSGRPLQNSKLLPHYQDSSLVICKSKLPSLSLSMSYILKFIKVYGLLRIPRPFCNGL